MNEILTAAFLVLIGSQEPCPTMPWSTMPWSGGIVGDSGFAETPRVDHIELRVVPARDRAALDEKLKQWLGPRCGGGESFTVNVLDVNAGRWLAFVQTKEVEVTMREERRPTGRITTREER